jgi:hypothetical protein
MYINSLILPPQIMPFKTLPIFLFFCASLCILASCKKNSFLTTGGNISFNTDTLTFDTVFTTQGSVTKWVLLRNENNKWIKVNRINLQKGAASPYRLNVDGKPTKDISNIDIAPFDSAYIFVAITIDPTSANNPFIIEDKLQATLNGKTIEMPLQAYGQNAIYIKDSVISTNQVWTKDKPYIILNYAFVDSNATLTMQPGTRVYGHANSALFVKGTLQCNGTKSDSIVFAGDRLDREYFGGDSPGEWCGLHFLEKSHDNILEHTTIKNGGAPFYFYDSFGAITGAITGALIYLEPNNTSFTTPKLILKSCALGISSQFGILSFKSSLDASNCLIYSCGANNVGVLEGGTYNFMHCTMANYGYKFYLKHDKESVLAMSNSFTPNPDIPSEFTGSNLNATFTNCIITGNITDGNEIGLAHKTNWTNNVVFNNCLLKQLQDLSSEATLNSASLTLLNKSVDFTDENKLDFTLKPSSIAKGAGQNTSIVVDIEDMPRANPPSIGCYE